MSEPNEHATRVMALTKALLKASELMEAAEWHECELVCLRASREARMLLLLERQVKEER